MSEAPSSPQYPCGHHGYEVGKNRFSDVNIHQDLRKLCKKQ